MKLLQPVSFKQKKISGINKNSLLKKKHIYFFNTLGANGGGKKIIFRREKKFENFARDSSKGRLDDEKARPAFVAQNTVQI